MLFSGDAVFLDQFGYQATLPGFGDERLYKILTKARNLWQRGAGPRRLASQVEEESLPCGHRFTQYAMIEPWEGVEAEACGCTNYWEAPLRAMGQASRERRGGRWQLEQL